MNLTTTAPALRDPRVPNDAHKPARIVRQRWRNPVHEHCHRLYMEMSQMREGWPGGETHADVDWVRDEHKGHGSFVELHDHNCVRLEHALHETLATMQRNRGVNLRPVRTEIASVCCDGEPVCALVIAVHESTPC